MTTATDDLTTLRERRRQLSDRLEELRSEQPDILADVAACEQDWLDAITVGEDATLLSERLELRKRELTSNRKAGEHVSSLLTGVDSQIADIESRERLAADVQTYHEARID
jgi:chromosome segregation ATPase